MGARHILKDKQPDLVLSGVNKGRNVAEDVVYSGTIAGALEGTILGIPSFALTQEFSMETRHKPQWETALKYGPDVIRKVMRRRAEGHRHQRQLSGLHARRSERCRRHPAGQAQSGIFERRWARAMAAAIRISGSGSSARRREPPAGGHRSCSACCAQCSVTPLRLDRTDDVFSEKLTRRFARFEIGEWARLDRDALERR